MHRRTLLLVVLLLALSTVAPRALPTAAQSATPATDQGEPPMPPGLSAEWVAGAPVTALPDKADLIVMIRLTLAPGAVLPADPNDPTAAFVVVESGTLTLQSAQPLTISRATGQDTPDLKLDQIAPNTKTTLAKGDAVYGGPQTPAEVSNEGSEPAVFLLVNFGPESQMGPPEATPAS